MSTKVIFGVGFVLLFLSSVMAEEAPKPYAPDLAAIHLHIVRKRMSQVRQVSTGVEQSGPQISKASSPQLVSAMETFIRRKQCDDLMDRCYRECKAGGSGPSHCNQTCTTDKQCNWSISQTYGDYLEQEIEALAAGSIRLARAN